MGVRAVRGLFQRAVEDNATVPLYYDARGEKLGIATNDLNERIAEKLEEIEIAMLAHPLVEEAVVLAVADISDEKRLIGYVMTPPGDDR